MIELKKLFAATAVVALVGVAACNKPAETNAVDANATNAVEETANAMGEGMENAAMDANAMAPAADANATGEAMNAATEAAH